MTARLRTNGGAALSLALEDFFAIAAELSGSF
jgi:hypothetical protein